MLAPNSAQQNSWRLVGGGQSAAYFFLYSSTLYGTTFRARFCRPGTVGVRASLSAGIIDSRNLQSIKTVNARNWPGIRTGKHGGWHKFMP